MWTLEAHVLKLFSGQAKVLWAKVSKVYKKFAPDMLTLELLNLYFILAVYRGYIGVHVGFFCLLATVEGLGLDGFGCRCGVSDAGVYLLAVGPSLAELDSILRLVELAFFTPKHCCFLVQELFEDQGPTGNHLRKPQTPALSRQPQVGLRVKGLGLGFSVSGLGLGV